MTLEEWAAEFVASPSGFALAVGAPRSGKTSAALNLVEWWRNPLGQKGRIVCIDPAFEMRYKGRGILYLTEPPDYFLVSAPPQEIGPHALIAVDEMAAWMEDRDSAKAVRMMARVRGPWKSHIIATTQRPVECGWVLGTADYLLIYQLTSPYDCNEICKRTGITVEEIMSLPPHECIIAPLRARPA